MGWDGVGWSRSDGTGWDGVGERTCSGGVRKTGRGGWNRVGGRTGGGGVSKIGRDGVESGGHRPKSAYGGCRRQVACSR